MSSLGIPGKKEQTNVIYLNTGFYEIFLTFKAFKGSNMYLTQKTTCAENISKCVMGMIS